MIRKRLQDLRKKMADNHVDVSYIGTNDYHMSEYISEHFKTLRYFSNFSGSLGSLIVDSENAYLFIDGRYHTQADQETEEQNRSDSSGGQAGRNQNGPVGF